MIIIKNNYYLYIENIKGINIEHFKPNKKINIIIRNTKNKLDEIIKFRKLCKIKRFKFFIANDKKLAQICKADGLYISAYNKKKYYINKEIIGSAHNIREINEKVKQNCKTIILSPLFKTAYKNKKNYFGVIKFNLFYLCTNKKIIPLGGINNKNFLKLNMLSSDSFAFLSGVKKKPAITSRLF